MRGVFDTHIRTHGLIGSGGGFTPSPGSTARIRLCPICRHLFDRDHEEAIRQNEVDQDALSIAFIIDRLGPAADPAPEETGFSVVEGS